MLVVSRELCVPGNCRLLLESSADEKRWLKKKKKKKKEITTTIFASSLAAFLFCVALICKENTIIGKNDANWFEDDFKSKSCGLVANSAHFQMVVSSNLALSNIMMQMVSKPFQVELTLKFSTIYVYPIVLGFIPTCTTLQLQSDSIELSTHWT